MIKTGYVTYYWQSISMQTLQSAIYVNSIDDHGNPELIPKMDTLGIAEGGVYGAPGTFYACARSSDVMETPAGCQLADPFIVVKLLGMWA